MYAPVGSKLWAGNSCNNNPLFVPLGQLDSALIHTATYSLYYELNNSLNHS